MKKLIVDAFMRTIHLSYLDCCDTFGNCFIHQVRYLYGIHRNAWAIIRLGDFIALEAAFASKEYVLSLVPYGLRNVFPSMTEDFARKSELVDFLNNHSVSGAISKAETYSLASGDE